MRIKIFTKHMTQDLYPKYIKNFQNSTIKEQKHNLKLGKRFNHQRLTTSPKNIYSRHIKISSVSLVIRKV